MRITTIGTGTAAPSASRVQSATLVECGDVRLLIDCGSGAVFRMAQLGIDWVGITHLALTHFHADHIADVATLVFAWRYGTLPPRDTPIHLLGPPGTERLLSRLADAFGEGLREALSIAVHEMQPGEPVSLGTAVTLEAHKVPHTEESVAYSVVGAGRRLVVSGDTGVDALLGEWARAADVLLLECSLPEPLAIPSHLTPRQCGEMAALARPSLLVLTHFYPPVESTDILSQVAERFDGPVVLAHDGWTIALQEN